MSSLNVCGDRVLVEPMEAQTQTNSGIILPTQAQEKPVIGKIVNVGEELEKLFAPGQEIIFSKYGGVEFPWEGTDYIFLRQSDILATVEHDG